LLAGEAAEGSQRLVSGFFRQVVVKVAAVTLDFVSCPMLSNRKNPLYSILNINESLNF
jgi:hypothetical protein